MILSEKKQAINSPENISKIIYDLLNTFDIFEREKEHFFVIGLDNQNVIQYIDLISIGTVSETIIHPREVFRFAILKNNSSLIIVHNHPSGKLVPSINDTNTTKRLIEAGKIIGILVIDHIIIGTESDYYSYKENTDLF